MLGAFFRRLLRAVVHGDETPWTIHVLAEPGESPRCWLRVFLSADAVQELFRRARKELVALPEPPGKALAAEDDPRRNPLQSVLNCQVRLEEFVLRVYVPIDKHVQRHMFIQMPGRPLNDRSRATGPHRTLTR